MTTPRAPSKQDPAENGGPIRFSSRLKAGRALAQDVWSIYKSVIVSYVNDTPVAHCVLFATVLRIFRPIA